MSEKLFEALKLGKKIPDSDHFLFKGLPSFLQTVGLITCRPVFQSRSRRRHRHSRPLRLRVSPHLSCTPNARKTTLLKCVAQLILLDEGKPFLWHKTPESWGFPCWRSKVLYVPQRPRIHPAPARFPCQC